MISAQSMTDKWYEKLREITVKGRKRHDERQDKLWSEGVEDMIRRWGRSDHMEEKNRGLRLGRLGDAHRAYWRSTVDWGGGAGFIVGRLPGPPVQGEDTGRVGRGTVREVRERCGLGGGRQGQGPLLDRPVGGQHNHQTSPIPKE